MPCPETELALPPASAPQARSVASPSGALRVLIVSACFPPYGWGGAEVAAEGIGKWLAEQGQDVAIYADVSPADAVARSGEGKRWFAPASGKWSHRTHQHGKQGPLRKALWHLLDHTPGRGLSDFREVAEAFKPDLVMVHLAPGLGIGLFDYCARHDLPVLYVVHDFWLGCLRSSMFSRSGAICAKRELLCRWSSSVRWGALSKVRRLGFWAPSNRIVEILREQIGDIFKNVLVERNVVDLADFRSMPVLPLGTRTRFLYVGKIIEAKGIAFVLECLASLPPEFDFEIDVLGGGDLEQPLRQKYAGDRRIRFHGVCGRAEVARYYQNATVLLVPSLWFEPAGLVIYQAQAASLPVVGSDSGGIPESLTARGDSVILPAGDRPAWVSQLRALISDRDLVARLRTSARRLAREADDALEARGRNVLEMCRRLIESS